MCFGTNLMLLHLIKDGQMTLEQAFNEGNSGQGRYPMACIKPGMGNLRMHGEICTGMTAADSAMYKCFGDPHFYAVSLKTMRLIIAWLNLIGGEGYWTDMTRQEVEGAAKRLFVKLLEPYGQ